jgi:predicted transcriptional regulator
MPSTSKKQHNFMAAIAHSPSFAKKAGVPQSVGKDFTEADKGKKFMNPRARKTGGKVVKMAKGGMRTKANWNTWEPADEEETKVSDFTPSDSFDEDEESEGVKSSNQARMREARARRRGADTQHTVPNLLANAVGSQTDAEEEAPKKQSFGEAFRAAKGSDFTWNGKKYSGKTKEQAAAAPVAKRQEPSVLPKSEPSVGSMSRSMSGTEKFGAGAGQSRAEQFKKANKEQADRDEAVKSGKLKSSFSKPFDVAEIMRQNQLKKAQGFKKGGKIKKKVKKYNGEEGSVVTGSEAAKAKALAMQRRKEEMAKQAAYERNMAPERAAQARDAERERIIQNAVKQGVRFDDQGRVKMGMKSGGSIRGGGCESRGKTRGKYV